MPTRRIQVRGVEVCLAEAGVGGTPSVAAGTDVRVAARSQSGRGQRIAEFTGLHASPGDEVASTFQHSWNRARPKQIQRYQGIMAAVAG